VCRQQLKLLQQAGGCGCMHLLIGTAGPVVLCSNGVVRCYQEVVPVACKGGKVTADAGKFQ
jgi:hypothetical protein